IRQRCGVIRSSCSKSTPRPTRPSRPTRWHRPADPGSSGAQAHSPGLRPCAMVVLGIETSCDESAAAVVDLTAAGPKILSDLIHSQLAEHMPYGGVVPEIAARAHSDHLDPLI